MIGKKLIEISVPGMVSTNSNREAIYEWRGTLERFFFSLPNCSLHTRKISIRLRFLLQKERMNRRGNDLDNLTKPILDALKRSGIIYDDDQIYQLEVSKFPTRGEEGVEIIIKDWD